MSKKIVLTEDKLAEIIAAAVKEATGKPAKKAKKAKKAEWTDRKGRTIKEAKKAHFEARQNRWENGKAASSGMTAAQRRELAATLPYGYTTRQWNAAVKEFKKAGFR